MSNETLLYVCGIILAVSAVGVSIIGLKVKTFPGKAMPIVALWFAVFVGATTTFAVLHAKDEETAKAAELQEAGHKAEEEGNEVPAGGEEGEEGGAEAAPEEGAEEAAPEEGEAGVEEAEEGGAAEEGGEAGGEEAEEGAAGGEEAEAGGEEGGGDPEAGKTVFAENCSICHGADGQGGNGGPDLRTMPKAKTESGSIEQVTDGGGGMPPFGEVLSEEEIENVAAYVVQDIAGEG